MPNSVHIISIVGPTATGKTAIALALAKNLLDQNAATKIEIISADSRQVYKDIPILSGADLPTQLDANISIHGIGILEANNAWSLGQFQEFGQKIIKKSIVENAVVIVVGGTGLYQQQLLANDWQIKVPPNLKMRQKLPKLALDQLQRLLKKFDHQKYVSLNNSDKNNPRRLIRAIEIAEFIKKNKIEIIKQPQENQVLQIGLTARIEKISKNISERIAKRLELNVEKEIQNLIKKTSEANQIRSATGVVPLIKLINKEIDKDECIKLWQLEESQYAKRQLTWFKKNHPKHEYNIEKQSMDTVIAETTKLALDFLVKDR